MVDLLSGTALGFRIDLLQLDPYPVGEDPIEQEEYEALLRVEIIEPDTAGEVIIANLPPDSIQLDPFTLDSLWIFGDILMLAVHFGGGCEDHKFCLVMSPASFMESFPVQANLYVRHDDHDDPCDAFIGENVSFDLTPIGDLYRLYYGSSGTVLLNVYEYFDNQPSAKQSVEFIFE